MRVLLLANDCNPEWSSLPGVGYRAAKAIAEHAEVVVATHVRNRDAIQRHGLGRADVEFIDNEYINAPLYKFGTLLRGGSSAGWTTAIAVAYPSMLAFEWEVWKRFKHELRAGRFDVVHRLTPMSPALASPMARWSPVPFVLGPINGGLAWPAWFRDALRREREYLTYLRGAHKLLPYHRSTFRRAAAILAGFAHTIEGLPRDCLERVIDFPEVGFDPVAFPGRASVDTSSGRPLTFLFAGRFVPLKLVDIAIRVFAESPLLRQQRLVLIGDGMERSSLERQVADAGLQGVVEFTGWRALTEVGALMQSADVFFFPSIRELGAGVVIEAMASGCVPAVVDYGGPGGLVVPGTGTKVPLQNRDGLVPAFRTALEAYVKDRAMLAAHSQAARRYALEHFSWDAKARKTLEVYEWVSGRRPTKPVF